MFVRTQVGSSTIGRFHERRPFDGSRSQDLTVNFGRGHRGKFGIVLQTTERLIHRSFIGVCSAAPQLLQGSPRFAVLHMITGLDAANRAVGFK